MTERQMSFYILKVFLKMMKTQNDREIYTSYKLSPALAGGIQEFQYQHALAKFSLLHLHPDDSMLGTQNDREIYPFL
jgi:hypothetical protein